jgi:hypothetical protein
MRRPAFDPRPFRCGLWWTKCRWDRFYSQDFRFCRSQWPHGLRRRSAAERLLGSWVRIPLRAWVFVSCTAFMLPRRGLCDGPIPLPEEFYRLWCVSECDQVKIKTLDTYCGSVDEERTTKQNFHFLLSVLFHHCSLSVRSCTTDSIKE